MTQEIENYDLYEASDAADYQEAKKIGSDNADTALDVWEVEYDSLAAALESYANNAMDTAAGRKLDPWDALVGFNDRLDWFAARSKGTFSVPPGSYRIY